MSSFSRQDIALIKKVRKWAESNSYDSRRNYFYAFLDDIGRSPSGYEVRLAYSIAQNLVLDESDLIDIMGEVWGLSSDEIYRHVF